MCHASQPAPARLRRRASSASDPRARRRIRSFCPPTGVWIGRRTLCPCCRSARACTTPTAPRCSRLRAGYGCLLCPGQADPHALCCSLLTALTDLAGCPDLGGPLAAPGGTARLEVCKNGRSLAWITLSDKGSQGLREDLSGPAIAEIIGADLPLCHSQGFLLPDEPGPLRALLTELALGLEYDLICTTGGTGLSPRDIAPQVTAALLDLPLPGFSQAMLAASLAKTPRAALSRAVAGVLGRSIVINLPGSRKAVLENLAAVLPALPHALDKLHGDSADCGG